MCPGETDPSFMLRLVPKNVGLGCLTDEVSVWLGKKVGIGTLANPIDLTTDRFPCRHLARARSFVGPSPEKTISREYFLASS